MEGGSGTLCAEYCPIYISQTLHSRVMHVSVYLSALYVVMIFADIIADEAMALDADRADCIAPDGNISSFAVLPARTGFQTMWLNIYQWLDLAFLLFFCFEIVICALADGCSYWRPLANCIDAFVVGVSLVISILYMLSSVDSTLESLRLLRVFRVLRFVRLITTVNAMVYKLLRARHWCCTTILGLNNNADDAQTTWGQLAWQDGSDQPNQMVALRPPAAGGYHLFVSHAWKYAQDTAGTIKSALRTILPDLVVFLDVDDLEDIGQLEHYVQSSDLVLIVLTEHYLSSRNCRRELAAAVALDKPVVLLVETDDSKGATTLARLRAEFEQVESTVVLSADDREACLALMEMFQEAQAEESHDDEGELPCKIIEWHREKACHHGSHSAWPRLRCMRALVSLTAACYLVCTVCVCVWQCRRSSSPLSSASPPR